MSTKTLLIEEKEINEWFHKSEVIEMLQIFAFRILEGFDEDNTYSCELNSELYNHAKYHYSRLEDCKELGQVIEQYAHNYCDMQMLLEDHTNRNLEVEP